MNEQKDIKSRGDFEELTFEAESKRRFRNILRLAI